MNFEHPVHNRNLSSLNPEHHDFSHSYWILDTVREEEEISSVECRLHAPTVLQQGQHFKQQHLSSVATSDASTMSHFNKKAHNILLRISTTAFDHGHDLVISRRHKDNAAI